MLDPLDHAGQHRFDDPHRALGLRREGIGHVRGRGRMLVQAALARAPGAPDLGCDQQHAEQQQQADGVEDGRALLGREAGDGSRDRVCLRHQGCHLRDRVAGALRIAMLYGKVEQQTG